MITVTEADSGAIRTAFYKEGEFAAVLEFRRRFPTISDDKRGRYFVRMIVAWGAIDSPRPVTEVTT